VSRWFLPWRKSSVSQATRLDQLHSVLNLARGLRDVFQANGDLNSARAFNDLADGADAALRDGFDQEALDRLSATMPEVPTWLDSRSVDFNGPREAWQEAIVGDYWDCWHAALELRVIGHP
jgi:hypothetical protein